MLNLLMLLSVALLIVGIVYLVSKKLTNGIALIVIGLLVGPGAVALLG